MQANRPRRALSPTGRTPAALTKPVAPTQPLDLTGSADGNGVVSLKWKRNGNITGTQFLIETRTDPAGPWTISGSTTTAKFTYQAVPGVYIAFRVTAVRRDQASLPSFPYAFWENGGEMGLQLAA